MPSVVTSSLEKQRVEFNKVTNKLLQTVTTLNNFIRFTILLLWFNLIFVLDTDEHRLSGLKTSEAKPHADETEV